MDAADTAEQNMEMEEARGSGYRARFRGDTRNACPHPEDEPLGAAWLDGWDLCDRRQRAEASHG